MTTSQPPRLMTPAEWAGARGIHKATVYRRIRHGEMDGRDADHPRVHTDHDGRVWVAPDAYTRVVEVEPPRDEAVAQLVRAEVARLFAPLKEALAQIEQGGAI